VRVVEHLNLAQRGAGLEDLQSSLLTLAILWPCELLMVLVTNKAEERVA